MSIGATTASTGAFTTLSASSTVTLSGGTINGVAFLNGSNVLTTGSALTWDGSALGVGNINSTGSIDLNKSGASPAIGFRRSNTYEAYITSVNGGGLEFQVGSGLLYKVNIDATGNVGIGTTSPQAKVEAYQSSSGSTAQVLRLANPNTAANTGAGIQWNLSSSNSVINGEISVYRDAATSGTMVFKNALATAGGALTETMRIDSSGNLGLGVTPSAWQVNNRAIQIYEGWGSISANNSQGCCDVSANCFNTGSAAITGWKYTNSSALASLYQQSAGVHKWLTAPVGTANNPINFTQAMTLDASGNLGLGVTSVTNYSGYKHLSIGGASKGIFTLTNASNVEKMYLQVIDDSTVKLDTNTGVALAFSTQGTERARIDTSGYMTAPYTPMFSAYKSDGNVSGSVSPPALVTFNAVQVNQSSSYSTSTGRFTAPVTGTYYFSFSGMLNTTNTAADLQITINKNGTAYSISNPPNSSGTAQGMGFACSCVMSLSAGDYATVTFYASNTTGASFYAGGGVFNNFSGFLIG
jgi:hypothetical protein